MSRSVEARSHPILYIAPEKDWPWIVDYHQRIYDALRAAGLAPRWSQSGRYQTICVAYRYTETARAVMYSVPLETEPPA